jgi:hypothetical protein
VHYREGHALSVAQDRHHETRRRRHSHCKTMILTVNVMYITVRLVGSPEMSTKLRYTISFVLSSMKALTAGISCSAAVEAYFNDNDSLSSCTQPTSQQTNH